MGVTLGNPRRSDPRREGHPLKYWTSILPLGPAGIAVLAPPVRAAQSGGTAPRPWEAIWASWPVIAIVSTLIGISFLVHALYHPESHRWRPLGRWGVIAVGPFFGFLLLGLGAGVTVRPLLQSYGVELGFYGVWISGVAMQGVFFGGSLVLAHWRLHRALRYWLFGDYPIFTGVLRGLGDYVRVYPLIVLAAIMNQVLVQLLNPQHPPPQSIQFLRMVEGVDQVLALVFLVVVIAPVVEEFLFRGIFYRILREWIPPVASAALSGVFFASLHFDPLVIVPLVVLGYFLGRTYEHTGSLLVVIVMHASQNTTSLIVFWLSLG